MFNIYNHFSLFLLVLLKFFNFFGRFLSNISLSPYYLLNVILYGEKDLITLTNRNIELPLDYTCIELNLTK